MEQRNVIMIAGKPGSGKSTLAKNLVKHYGPTEAIQTVSIGQDVRAIYRHKLDFPYTNDIIRHLDSVDPYSLMGDELAYEVLLHAFRRHRNASLLFVDGFPRRASQVSDLYNLSASQQANLLGVLHVNIDDDEALSRQLKRRRAYGEAVLDTIDAQQRLKIYHEHMPATLRALTTQGHGIEHIPSKGSKQETLRHALGAVSFMLTPYEHEYGAID